MRVLQISSFNPIATVHSGPCWVGSHGYYAPLRLWSIGLPGPPVNACPGGLAAVLLFLWATLASMLREVFTSLLFKTRGHKVKSQFYGELKEKEVLWAWNSWLKACSEVRDCPESLKRTSYLLGRSYPFQLK